jgi:hypothetical protein
LNDKEYAENYIQEKEKRDFLFRKYAREMENSEYVE